MKRFLFAVCILSILIIQNVLFPQSVGASGSTDEVEGPPLDASTLVGTAVEELTAKYGEPARTEPSEFGFVWYIYSQDYANFIMAGVRDGAVVAVYTNSGLLSYGSQFNFGSTRVAVRNALGLPAALPECSHTIQALCADGQKDTFAVGDNLAVVFYDKIHGGHVTALLILPQADEADALLYRSELMDGQSSVLVRISEDIAKAAEARIIAVENGSEAAAPQDPLTDATEREMADALVEYALIFIGCPYESGEAGPDSFECSGLTYYVFKQFGVTIPRKAQGQGYADYGIKIEDRADLLPGDLVFFNSNPDDEDLCDHVGIYIGRGKFVHSPAPGMQVKISNLTRAKDFSWGRRIFE